MEPDRIGVLSSLSEPVRRRVYDLVVDAGEVNRDGAAERLGLARSVAAFHLDKLVDVGLLDVSYRRPPGQGGPGAGRPAKWYRRASWELTVSLPDRRYELAARLLAAAVDQAVERSQPVTRALRLVANRYGRQLGAAVSADEDPARAEALVRALRGHGYEPRRVDGLVVLGNCPFRALAEEHRELVCTMNLHLLRGLAQAAALPASIAQVDPRPGCCCVTLAA